MTGKNMNIGPRLVAPPTDVKYSTIMPPAATSMATGIRRASGLPGNGSGTSGGGSTLTFPFIMGGAGSRGSRVNSIV